MERSASIDDGDAEESQLFYPPSRRRSNSWRWVREGGWEVVVPLAVLSLLSVAVLVYNIFVRRQWDPCDTSNRFAKHFYCWNSTAEPGVHVDRQ